MTSIKEALSKYKKVAVVGISPKPDRPSFRVSKYLKDMGFNVIGVRPNSDSIEGIPVVNSLLDLKGDQIEIVDVFRASENVPFIVDEAIAIEAKVLWLQEGVSHPEAEQKAREAGLFVVSDICILKEHKKLL